MKTKGAGERLVEGPTKTGRARVVDLDVEEVLPVAGEREPVPRAGDRRVEDVTGGEVDDGDVEPLVPGEVDGVREPPVVPADDETTEREEVVALGERVAVDEDDLARQPVTVGGHGDRVALRPGRAAVHRVLLTFDGA